MTKRTTKPKSRTRLASDAHDKLMALKQRLAAEIADATSRVNDRYEAKVAAIRASLDAESLAYLDRLLRGELVE